VYLVAREQLVRGAAQAARRPAVGLILVQFPHASDRPLDERVDTGVRRGGDPPVTAAMQGQTQGGPSGWFCGYDDDVAEKRDRSLASLGLTTVRPVTVGLGVLFAGVQFALTLWGYDLPAAEAWVPLLVMSLVDGAIEAVFFRGFIQGRLEASFGTAPAVAGAAGLYALYHVGYGMAADDIVFLFGLGVVYAIAFRLAGSVLVLWPLLTPLGALYANLEAGDIELPWESIAGFVDVAVVMAVLVWLGHRHQRRRPDEPPRGFAPPSRLTRDAVTWRSAALIGRIGPSRRLPAGPLRVQRRMYYIVS
jgi:membrane protease YdiL (CAAX protease family)